jgi:hypothetical protein
VAVAVSAGGSSGHFYDYHIGVIAAATGGWRFINQPLLLYRQHREARTSSSPAQESFLQHRLDQSQSRLHHNGLAQMLPN